jgi:RimJ/RimL family protein N-acetyltransferase
LLAGRRVRLRRWNADPRVMEFFFEGAMNRAGSDALIDRIEKHIDEHGFGAWALEVPDVAPFIGFAGLSVPRFTTLFTPCVEIGWRLAPSYWGRGYATEAARVALAHGFGPLEIPEIVSFTAATNLRSRAVMERLGMRRDAADDFDYPGIPEGHALRPHVLYRLRA